MRWRCWINTAMSRGCKTSKWRMRRNMPDCIRANTNVTSMVIGERVADFNLGRQVAESR